MNKKHLIFLSTLAISLSLVGCNPSSSKLQIKLDDAIPVAYVGEEYDFSPVIIKDSGVDYSISCYYQDYYEKKEYEIPVNGFSFTPTTTFDVSVVVSATKGSESVKRTAIVYVEQKADPIDALAVTGGFGGWSDPGFRKEITTDSKYLKGKKSSTAINLMYQGNNVWTWGGGIFSFNNFRYLEHWSDKTWDNALLTMWIYNPTEYEFEFQLRVMDEYTKLVNLDWGQPLAAPQKAEPNKWTQIFFSLKHIGVTHTLYQNEDGSRNDQLTLKTKWAGAPKTTPTPLYTFQMYVDCIDIVPESMYPGVVDTNCYTKAENCEYGLENLPYDTREVGGYGSSLARYSRDVVYNKERQSLSSTWLMFKNAEIKDWHLGYSVVWSPQDGIATKDIRVLPDFTHGLLTADIKFNDSITDHTVNVLAVQKDWTTTPIVKNVPLTALEDGWYRITLDLATIDEFASVKETIRFGLCFPGVTDSNKATAEIFVDNIIFDQNGGSPVVERETLEDGLENMALDTGWNGSKLSYDSTVTYGDKSRTSAKLTFNNVDPINKGYGVSFSPEMHYSSGELKVIDGSKGTIDLDIRYSDDITNKEVDVILIQNSSWADVKKTYTPTPTTDGWYHLSIDLASDGAFSSITYVIRMLFYFPGVSDTNKTTASVHIDNLFYK